MIGKDKVEVKEIGENRSNLEVRFAKRVLGIRQIEIRRDGALRIFAYNMSETESKLFTSLENDVKIKIGGKYTYIDFPNVSKEIITLVTNVL